MFSPNSSSTAIVPSRTNPTRGLCPKRRSIAGAVADIFDALVATLSDTRLEPDLEELLWSTVNLFHRAIARIERELDDNEQAQRRSQKEQDGSEIRSVELERLIAEGQTLIERRNGMELFRDHAADQFERHTGSTWRPRSGSKVNHRALTSAMIDSRDFLAAKRRAENEMLLPAGPKVAFTGGLDFNDHRAIWDRLDKALRQASRHGAAAWRQPPRAPSASPPAGPTIARSRRSPSNPTGRSHAKAAPFKRNDAMLETSAHRRDRLPRLRHPANLADKARKLGIPVWKFEEGGA